ncbi:hypothetical protein IWX85_002049 [Polaromonas sp. CG_9.11]|nr:hypothetical protein [Polaromonas sp. CG_9.11]
MDRRLQSITRQAKLLKLIRGTVYYLPEPVSPADLALMRQISWAASGASLHGHQNAALPTQS